MAVALTHSFSLLNRKHHAILLKRKSVISILSGSLNYFTLAISETIYC